MVTSLATRLRVTIAAANVISKADRLVSRPVAVRQAVVLERSTLGKAALRSSRLLLPAMEVVIRDGRELVPSVVSRALVVDVEFHVETMLTPWGCAVLAGRRESFGTAEVLWGWRARKIGRALGLGMFLGSPKTFGFRGPSGLRLALLSGRTPEDLRALRFLDPLALASLAEGALPGAVGTELDESLCRTFVRD